MTHKQFVALHCINPDCASPASGHGSDRFCQSCGTPLLLNGRYLPLQRLGTGGFAIAYTVYDRQQNIERVLKVLVETAPKALTLFEQEAQVLASLRHPGIPQVDRDGYFQVAVNYPQSRLLPCLVMEKIEGQTLDEVLRQYPQGCPESLVVDWLMQAADILQELHRHQIIHRDLKPANLMVRMSSGYPRSQANAGQLVAIDFGGVKQLSAHQANSTRLFSPGYSPPEQMAGGIVGPTADLYALGRTAIHLLTGRSPADLDDPIDGECRWRQYAQVSPILANLLDETIALQVSHRLASATELQARLSNASHLKTLVRHRRLNLADLAFEFVERVADRSLKVFWTIAKFSTLAIASVTVILSKTIAGLLGTSFSLVSWCFTACFDTILATILGGLGASVGAGTGFILAYWLPVGQRLSDRFTDLLSRTFPETNLAIDPVILLFAMAGLGTALGLTEAGSFGQRRRFLTAGIIAILGYGLGGLMLSETAIKIAEPDLVGFSAIAIASLTLGLGLPKPHLFHATIGAIGVAVLMAVFLTYFPFPMLLDLFSTTSAIGWSQFWDSIAFFAVLGITGSFCLGVSYYVLMPFLRLLGFR